MQINWLFSLSQNPEDFALSPRGRRGCRKFLAVLIGIVLVISVSNLLAWVLGFANSPQLTVMRVNSAVGLMLGGISLWLWRDERVSGLRRRIASGAGLIMALIGTLTSLQYLTGWDLHIDQALIRQNSDFAAQFATYPGRMSLNSAVAMMVAGLALALLGFEWRGARGRTISVAPALAILAILPVLTALVGYVMKLGYFTGILGSTNTLLHTALGQLALCLGVLAARPDRQPLRLILSSGPAGMLLRRLGPAMAALLIGLGWIVHRGQQAKSYGEDDALALMILFGLMLLSALLFMTATALGRADASRRRADAAMREHEERFRMLADNISQLAWMADAGGAIFWYNKRWSEYTGTTPKEVGWAGWQAVHHPDHAARVAEKFRLAQASGLPWEDTFPIRGRLGEWRWFLTRAIPMKDAEGKMVGWFGTNTDVTEQRAAADALAAAKEAAEEANRAKDDFLATLSHELRTPLTPILMTAEELCDDPALPLEVRQQLRMVRRNVRLEARLIDDLLDVTRVRRGKFALRSAPCDLQAVVREALDIVREDVAGRSLHLVEELEGGPAWAMGDSTRLEQVFWNLLRNAVKFTASGGTLTVRTRVEGTRWVAEIEDTGIGIAPEVLAQLFQPFEQGSRINHHRCEGLGLGLAICKSIVGLHGGQIDVRSAGTGCGATFRVVLGPLLPAPEEVAPVPAATTSALPPLRLLLVEDHAPTREVLSRMLRRGGHIVTAAHDVASALAAAESAGGNFDAVVCDLGLPDGSGHELMVQLRERYHLGGIAVSGYGTDADLRRSAEAGFVAHLTKPVEFGQLREPLARASAQTAELAVG